MKQIKQFASRLRQRAARRKDKAGSSMALVMIITSALVIWAVALAPLMTTTGTNALKLETSYDEYLSSRAAIEYAKSELEYIVETTAPYTFAVTRAEDGTFGIVPKRTQTSSAPTGAYDQLIVPQTGYDKDILDVPEDDAYGRTVAAICAVTPPTSGSNKYTITITSYNNGVKGISYTAIFTLKGSLMINPESYRQSEALPLSDFVVVDGILGGKYANGVSGNWVANQLWESTISTYNATSLNFRENFLPWKDPALTENDAALIGYADAGQYPILFKTTAEAALDDTSHNIGDPLEDPPLTSEIWVKPSAYTSESEKRVGTLKIGSDHKTIEMWYNNAWNNVTSRCTVYYNGSSAFPTSFGKYRVTVDFRGTGEYVSGGTNVLPVYGLVMETFETGLSAPFNPPTEAKIIKVDYTPASKDKNNQTIPASATVTLEGNATSGTLIYGHSTSVDATNVRWDTSNTITIDPSKINYFFCAVTDGVDNTGTFRKGSSAVYAGMVYPYTVVNTPTSGKQYLVMNSSGTAMVASGNSLGVSAAATAAGSRNAGVLYNTPSTMVWDTSKNSDWTFQNVGTSQYLSQDQSSISLSNNAKTVKIDGSAASNGSFIYTEYQYSSNWCSSTGYAYLVIGNNGVSLVTNNKPDSARTYFVEVPEDLSPSIISQISSSNYERSYTPSPSENIVSTIKTAFPDVATVYANDTEISSSLGAPGVYYLTGTLTDGRQVYLGTATVSKRSLNALTVTATTDTQDDKSVTISADWSDNGGVHYFGYRNNTESDASIKWFSSTDDSFTFRLPYGTYVFVASDSGNTYYSTVEGKSADYKLEAVTITNVDASAVTNLHYTVSEDGTITWYGILPEKVNVGKLKLMYGKRTETVEYHWLSGRVDDRKVEYTWSETPKSGYNLYGLKVAGSTKEYIYETDTTKDSDKSYKYRYVYECNDKTVILFHGPLGTSHVAGHQSSMLSASSMYFMGGGESGTGKSINTYGNDIFLKTDLLVLNSSITGTQLDANGNLVTGRVVVEPYNMDKALLFAVHDIYPYGSSTPAFYANCLYTLVPGADIYNPTASSYQLVGELDYDDTDAFTRFKDILRSGYPKLNLDICFADDDQLPRIISSETLGWTTNGILSGSNSSSNPQYAVCTFVNRISDNTSYKANRVLIAGADDQLTVPYNVTFSSRYLSLTTSKLQKGASTASFTLKNLGQDQDFVQWLADLLSITNYSSKSLQVDFEQTTSFIDTDGTTEIKPALKPQISRFANNTDLLSASNLPMDLMAEYKTSEVNSLFSSGLLSWLSSAVKIVDRYVALLPDSETGSTVDIYAALNLDLDLYTNYLYIDPRVTEINLSSYRNRNISFTISSQENGYTTDEYLGWFKGHSADAYSGTLMYFGGEVKIKIGGSTVNTIPKGFYYIPASDADGVSLLTFNYAEHIIDPEMLAQYSIYIDPVTGKISDAYIDTGLEDSSTTMGGFSEGKVE